MTPMTILTALFTANGVMAGAFFVPQIYVLATSTGRSKALSITSQSMGTYSAVVGLLYALLIAHDTPLLIGYTIGLTGNALVLGLTVYNRYFRFGPEVLV